MKSRLVVASILAAAAGLGLWASPSPLSFSTAANLSLPLGNDAAVFDTSYGAALGASMGLGYGLPLELIAGLSFTSEPVRDSGGASISVIALACGTRFTALDLGFARLGLSASIGGFAAFLAGSDKPGFNPMLAADLDISFGKGAFRPFARVSYQNALGLSQNLSFGAGLAFAPAAFPAAPRQPATKAAPAQPAPKPLVIKSGPLGLQVIGLELSPVYPAFYRYYESNELGRIVVKNGGSAPIEVIQANLLIKQYMDNPKECAGPATLKPGEEATIPLYALFNDSILGVSEGNKVSGSLSLEYSVKGKQQRLELTTALSLYDRNALTWSDDRRAAAFVTAKDPLVLKFSKNLAGFLDDSGRFGLPKAFRDAMGVFESLRAYGMRYVIDPTSSYAEVSKDGSAVDFVQFPRQTLDYKAGDCDDLSVLTCALLESLGAKAAFITVPGHIFVATDLEMSPDEARAKFPADLLVIEDGRVWLPIEITALADDFLKAWDLGAREWREAYAKGLATLYPVAEAWKTYAPVGFVTETAQAQPPDAAKLGTLCLGEIERYIEHNLESAVAKVQADIRKEGRTPRLVNKLAVLYASSGLRSRAKDLFTEATAKKDFAPALVNLGNLSFLDKDFNAALGFYQRAYRLDAQNPRVVLAIARADHELENYGQAREYYATLKKLDAALAAQFSYLDLRGEEATRAADVAGTKETVVWTE